MSALFHNPGRLPYVSYDVDGCLVKAGLAADCAVEEVGTGLVVVEFKGRNVEHALKQVDATVRYFREERAYPEKIAALIVSRESPLGSSTLNRHRLAFAKRHQGAALQVASSAKDFVLADVLAHRSR